MQCVARQKGAVGTQRLVRVLHPAFHLFMTENERGAGARPIATFIGLLAIAQMATVLWLVQSCAATAAITLTVEALGVLIAALIIRAGLRPAQRHRVK